MKVGTSSKIFEVGIKLNPEILVKNFKEETFRAIQATGKLKAARAKMINIERVNNLIDQGQDLQMTSDFYDFEIWVKTQIVVVLLWNELGSAILVILYIIMTGFHYFAELWHFY